MSKAKPDRSVAVRRPVEHDILLAALPHPILVIADENRVVYANAAAEAFLSTGIAMMKRGPLDDVLSFGCPLLALIVPMLTGPRLPLPVNAVPEWQLAQPRLMNSVRPARASLLSVPSAWRCGLGAKLDKDAT